ncbi:hypothetical protein [Burkholderia phage vB_BglM_WTB]
MKHIVHANVSKFVSMPVRAVPRHALPNPTSTVATFSNYRIPLTSFRINLTGWYPEGTKPAREGVYLVRIPNLFNDAYRVAFAYWAEGKWFQRSIESPAKAEEYYKQRRAAIYQAEQTSWRGLYRDLFTHERAQYDSKLYYASRSQVAAQARRCNVSDAIAGAAQALADSNPVPLDKTIATLAGKLLPSPKKPRKLTKKQAAKALGIAIPKTTKAGK